MLIRKRWAAIVAAAAVVSCPSVHAAEASANLHHITGGGEAEPVGSVTFTDSEYGLIVTPALENLQSRGLHGTHIHANPDCGATRMGDHMMPGGAAGGHYDPEQAGRHAGPYGDGHLGDLPNLTVEDDGSAATPVLAPRLTVADLEGRAVMVHAEVDRYDDHGTHHHGKGGMRMYCGVIE